MLNFGKKLWILSLLAQGTALLAVDNTSGSARSFAHLYKRETKIRYPKDNLPTPERIELGRELFFDPRLSGSNWISCATCHNPAFSWGDGLAKGLGHGMKELGRRSPTVLNLAWSETFFWDGRANSLEEQALGPIQSGGEMNLPLTSMVSKVTGIAEYVPQFKKAYPGEPMNEKTVAKAVAAFERTIISSKAPFDKWLEGNEKAISEESKAGFVVFNTKGNCASCHSGWRFTDDSFHDIGLIGDDIGRAKILEGVASMNHAFKTPTLRNVDRRGPYMHDGSEATLEKVVDLYNAGGRDKRESLSPDIKPLNLSESEIKSLIAFMKTLTSRDPEIAAPSLPH